MNKNKSDCDKCRLCLVVGDKNDFTPIFDDNDESGASLAVRIMIQPKDSFPRNVCKSCDQRVTDFYAFREICYNSYYTLLRAETSYDDGKKNFTDDDEGNTTSGHISNGVDDVKEETEPNAFPAVSRLEKIDRHSEENIQVTSVIISDNDDVSEQKKLQTDYVAEETISHSVETEEKNSEETNFDDDDARDVKYKCLACDEVFADLDSATIHCAVCSHAVVDDDQSETIEYLDDSYKDDSEKLEETDKLLTATLNNKNKLEIRDVKKRKSESSSSIRKRKINDKNSSHSCGNCDGVFSSAALLRRHAVVHTGERPFECSICKKRFSQVGQLNFHKKFHVNPRYRCDVCDKPFLRPSDIEKHMRTHTGEKPYVCNVCAKSFAQLVALQQHERIHTGDKPYDCEICGKRFSQKANKTKHLKIHKEGAKPHTCEICGRSFSDLEEMNLHRAGHGGGKPRKCNYCDERFRKMSELGQHVRRYHTFERPHKCAFCQKAFYSLYNLKQHVMVHTGQKPYACSRCDLKFTQKGNLTKHFDRKHVDKYSVVTDGRDSNNDEISISDDKSTETNNFYACTRCDLIFKERENLMDHYQRKHGDCKTNKIKYIVIKRHEMSEAKEGVFLLADTTLSECIDDPLLIEREESIQVVMGEENVHHSNLQIYDIAE